MGSLGFGGEKIRSFFVFFYCVIIRKHLKKLTETILYQPSRDKLYSFSRYHLSLLLLDGERRWVTGPSRGDTLPPQRRSKVEADIFMTNLERIIVIKQRFIYVCD